VIKENNEVQVATKKIKTVLSANALHVITLNSAVKCVARIELISAARRLAQFKKMSLEIEASSQTSGKTKTERSISCRPIWRFFFVHMTFNCVR
jgi:hypothetical protein